MNLNFSIISSPASIALNEDILNESQFLSFIEKFIDLRITCFTQRFIALLSFQ